MGRITAAAAGNRLKHDTCDRNKKEKKQENVGLNYNELEVKGIGKGNR